MGGAVPEAKVQWLRKDVLAKAPSMLDWLEATREMGLWKLYKVTTGKGSAAGIQFEDSSKLRMRESALLVIYGGAAARAKVKRKRGTTVVVERGTVRGGLGSLDAKSDLVIKTPAAEVTLRSTSAQIQVDEKKSSVISVYDGQAQVAAKGVKVKVPAGFGTRVKKGKKPRKPRRLPAPPRWNEDGDSVVMVAPGHMATFRSKWKKVKRAARYRVELAKDKAFRFPIVDAQVGAGILSFEARDLGPGRYYARVSAKDKLKLEGRPSRTSVVEVHEIRSSRKLIPGGKGEPLQVAGLVMLQPAESAAGSIEVSVNGAPFVASTTPARLSKPGAYTLRYRKRGGSGESSIKVKVLELKAGLTPPEKPLEVAGSGGAVELVLSDEDGRPVALPGLGLTAYPGGELTLKRLGAGRHGTTVPSPAKYEAQNTVLVARWAGGELRRDLLKVKAPAEAPPPEPASAPEPEAYRWLHAPVALESPRKGPGLPARAARPMTTMGISAFLSQEILTEDILLRLALRGELALLDGDLGIDLDLPVLLLDTTLDSAGDSDIGDIRVGFKYLALDRWGLALAPSLRVTAPSGGYQRNNRFGTLLEPGVLLEWSWREMLTLGTNQIFIADLAPDFDANLHYAGTYAAAVRLWRLSLALELGTIFGIQEPGAAELSQAVSLGGAVRVHLDRARIGIAGGGGLNNDGQRIMGRFSLGLTADLGFDWL